MAVRSSRNPSSRRSWFGATRRPFLCLIVCSKSSAHRAPQEKYSDAGEAGSTKAS